MYEVPGGAISRVSACLYLPIFMPFFSMKKVWKEDSELAEERILEDRQVFLGHIELGVVIFI